MKNYFLAEQRLLGFAGGDQPKEVQAPDAKVEDTKTESTEETAKQAEALEDARTKLEDKLSKVRSLSSTLDPKTAEGWNQELNAKVNALNTQTFENQSAAITAIEDVLKRVDVVLDYQEKQAIDVKRTGNVVTITVPVMQGKTPTQMCVVNPKTLEHKLGAGESINFCGSTETGWQWSVNAPANTQSKGKIYFSDSSTPLGKTEVVFDLQNGRVNVGKDSGTINVKPVRPGVKAPEMEAPVEAPVVRPIPKRKPEAVDPNFDTPIMPVIAKEPEEAPVVAKKQPKKAPESPTADIEGAIRDIKFHLEAGHGLNGEALGALDRANATLKKRISPMQKAEALKAVGLRSEAYEDGQTVVRNTDIMVKDDNNKTEYRIYTDSEGTTVGIEEIMKEENVTDAKTEGKETIEDLKKNFTDALRQLENFLEGGFEANAADQKDEVNKAYNALPEAVGYDLVAELGLNEGRKVDASMDSGKKYVVLLDNIKNEVTYKEEGSEDGAKKPAESSEDGAKKPAESSEAVNEFPELAAKVQAVKREIEKLGPPQPVPEAAPKREGEGETPLWLSDVHQPYYISGDVGNAQIDAINALRAIPENQREKAIDATGLREGVIATRKWESPSTDYKIDQDYGIKYNPKTGGIRIEGVPKASSKAVPQEQKEAESFDATFKNEVESLRSDIYSGKPVESDEDKRAATDDVNSALGKIAEVQHIDAVRNAGLDTGIRVENSYSKKEYVIGYDLATDTVVITDAPAKPEQKEQVDAQEQLRSDLTTQAEYLRETTTEYNTVDADAVRRIQETMNELVYGYGKLEDALAVSDAVIKEFNKTELRVDQKVYALKIDDFNHFTLEEVKPAKTEQKETVRTREQLDQDLALRVDTIREIMSGSGTKNDVVDGQVADMDALIAAHPNFEEGLQAGNEVVEAVQKNPILGGTSEYTLSFNGSTFSLDAVKAPAEKTDVSPERDAALLKEATDAFNQRVSALEAQGVEGAWQVVETANGYLMQMTPEGKAKGIETLLRGQESLTYANGDKYNVRFSRGGEGLTVEDLKATYTDKGTGPDTKQPYDTAPDKLKEKDALSEKMTAIIDTWRDDSERNYFRMNAGVTTQVESLNGLIEQYKNVDPADKDTELLATYLESRLGTLTDADTREEFVLNVTDAGAKLIAAPKNSTDGGTNKPAEKTDESKEMESMREEIKALKELVKKLTQELEDLKKQKTEKPAGTPDTPATPAEKPVEKTKEQKETDLEAEIAKLKAERGQIDIDWKATIGKGYDELHKDNDAGFKKLDSMEVRAKELDALIKQKEDELKALKEGKDVKNENVDELLKNREGLNKKLVELPIGQTEERNKIKGEIEAIDTQLKAIRVKLNTELTGLPIDSKTRRDAINADIAKIDAVLGAPKVEGKPAETPDAEKKNADELNKQLGTDAKAEVKGETVEFTFDSPEIAKRVMEILSLNRVKDGAKGVTMTLDDNKIRLTGAAEILKSPDAAIKLLKTAVTIAKMPTEQYEQVLALVKAESDGLVKTVVKKFIPESMVKILGIGSTASQLEDMAKKMAGMDGQQVLDLAIAGVKAYSGQTETAPAKEMKKPAKLTPEQQEQLLKSLDEVKTQLPALLKFASKSRNAQIIESVKAMQSFAKSFGIDLAKTDAKPATEKPKPIDAPEEVQPVRANRGPDNLPN